MRRYACPFPSQEAAAVSHAAACWRFGPTPPSELQHQRLSFVRLKLQTSTKHAVVHNARPSPYKNAPLNQLLSRYNTNQSSDCLAME